MRTDSETDTMCDICLQIIPSMDVMRKGSDQVRNKVTYVDNGTSIICPNCLTEYLQHQKMLSRELNLKIMYNNTMNLYEYKWSQTYRVLDPTQFVNSILALNSYSDDKLFLELTKPMHYKCIDVKRIYDNYNEIADNIIGVGMPLEASIESMHPNMISSPVGCFGIITLPQGKDFIILEEVSLDDISVLEMSLNEMKYISKGLMSPRAGAAGGIMLPSGSSKSLSPVTNNDRLLLPRKKSVGVSLTYTNKENNVKSRNSIYQDLYMKRFTRKQKFKNVFNSKAYQRILVREMISRLRSFFLLHEKGILCYQETIFNFLTYDKERIDMEVEFKSIGCTNLEAKLLSWSCRSGEMRNHQSVRAHYDGNKCHPVETMSIFGRLPINIQNMTTKVLQKTRSGFLLLPLDGVTIKMNCGATLVHCSLKKTVHLADNTRNTCNWTRVHGP